MDGLVSTLPIIFNCGLFDYFKLIINWIIKLFFIVEFFLNLIFDI
jgi:hypothetical protein